MPAASNPDKPSRCPVCGKGQLHARRVSQRFEHEIEGEKVTVVAENVPVRVCDACGETLLGPEAARLHTEALGRALGLLSPTEIRSFRESLGKSLAEFAHLTGVREEDLSEWERSRALPSRPVDRYLRLLIRNPENLRLLEEWETVAAPGTAPVNGPQSQGSGVPADFPPANAAGDRRQ
ncbi:MAG: type II toxin-antitoxin system MqsA family antitoxin [Gemmataceae bacterium]|nr:type II toxin-antitoxin system MqsA family antitoxin [Gemmataceae bacterium]